MANFQLLIFAHKLLPKQEINKCDKRVPDGSHWVIHEKPAEVNSYISAFIQSAKQP